MKIGYLIVNYNDFENTNNLVNLVKKFKCINEIVVVDNNSKESEKEKLKDIKAATIIYAKENKGYSSAINIGSKYLIKSLGHCYIIISNADIVIENENDIYKLVDTFDDNIAIVAPNINQNGVINNGWKMPKVYHEILFNIPYIHRFIKRKLNYNLISKITNVDVVSGCFFIINSEVLEQIDYLDENVFLYYEENILSKKIQNLNKKVVINNEVVIQHNHSVTIDKNLDKIKKYKVLKASQYYFNKFYNNANILELLLLKTTYYISYTMYYVWYFITNLFK